ncbi:hypothetical protein Ahy_A03g012416 [Arachis hypogaea]|uniref:adenylate kinase n=1 Tax=Arachis hypogaea TaxID=3818 RepID=A0A445DTC0_ARAHY|nr:hypothetical protein Ahy_A03g012416 [Arachis hypogaea]
MSVNMVAVASLATPSITISFTNSKSLTLSYYYYYYSSFPNCWPSSNSTLRPLILRCGAAAYASSSFLFTSPNSNSSSVVMISGAPAFEKGTQCELIKHKYGLVHVATDDLLRAEITTGSDNGKLAICCMYVCMHMVKDRLLKPDAKNSMDICEACLRLLPSNEVIFISRDLFVFRTLTPFQRGTVKDTWTPF